MQRRSSSQKRDLELNTHWPPTWTAATRGYLSTGHLRPQLSQHSRHPPRTIPNQIGIHIYITSVLESCRKYLLS